MELKDVIHFYLGCDGLLTIKSMLADPNTGTPDKVIQIPATLVSINSDWRLSFKCKDENGRDWADVVGGPVNDFRPFMRPLSSITDEEKKEIYAAIFGKPFPGSGVIVFRNDTSLTTEPRWVLMSGVDRVGIEMNGTIWADCDLHHFKFNQHEITRILLLRRFDLFGRIEAGQAIDQTTKPQ